MSGVSSGNGASGTSDASRVNALWVDTHCHLQLLDDVPSAVADAERAGVAHVVCVGIDTATSAVALEVAAAHNSVWATVGLHPHEARHVDAEWPELERLASASRVVAIGETGLDFHRDLSPRDVQTDAFARHIGLAKERGLPLVVHTRDAWDACFAVLEDEEPPERLVFHCFSGGPAEARHCVDLGAYISIAGPVTYPKNDALREAVRSTPLGRIVVETDAPFLSPQQHRGKTNYPARVALIGDALAAALGRDTAEVSAATSQNATHLFGLPPV